MDDDSEISEKGLDIYKQALTHSNNSHPSNHNQFLALLGD
jgi:hypothetical protein